MQLLQIPYGIETHKANCHWNIFILFIYSIYTLSCHLPKGKPIELTEKFNHENNKIYHKNNYSTTSKIEEHKTSIIKAPSKKN